MVGGSSAINAMMYIRGPKEDYNDWSSFAKGWSWPEIAPYFKRHESFQDNRHDRMGFEDLTPNVPTSHGYSGPIQTSFNTFDSPIEKRFLEAGREVSGLNKPKGPWGGDHTIKFEDSRTALALGIIVEEGVARGVRFSHSTQQLEILANREVIVSCGVFKSPQLLEFSGIGDPSILKAAGVGCVVPLPSVRTNLQDHVVTGVVYELVEDQSSMESLSKPEIFQKRQEEYAAGSTGLFASTSSGMGFLPYATLVPEAELEDICRKMVENCGQTLFEKKQSESIISHLRNPQSANVQLIVVSASADFSAASSDQFGSIQPTQSTNQRDGFAIASAVQYPASKGTVHIISSDPLTYPAIDPAYLANEADTNVLAASLALCDKLSESPHVKQIISRRVHPDPSINLSDQAQAVEVVRGFCMTQYHPCGTCAMGNVVDERLRVKGIKGLRVVDASVFPTHVSGNIMSSVYAVVEKAADMIKEDAHISS